MFAGFTRRFVTALRRAAVRSEGSLDNGPYHRLSLFELATAAFAEDDMVVMIIGNADATRTPIFADGVSGLLQ